MDRIVLYLTLLCFAVGCSKGYDPPQSASPPAATMRIADLKRLFAGDLLVVHDAIVVEGVVTSSDAAGNLYHSLYIEEDGAAIELLMDCAQIHPRYPMGCRLLVALEGLALDRAYGVVQVGMLSSLSGRPTIEEISSQPLMDRHLFRKDETLEIPQPTTFRVSELSEEDCGRLVRIESLIYSPEGEEEPLWGGLHRLLDPMGNPLYVQVSSYADFANKKIPTTGFTLQGILRKGQKGYQILPRDEEDILPDL